MVVCYSAHNIRYGSMVSTPLSKRTFRQKKGSKDDTFLLDTSPLALFWLNNTMRDERGFVGCSSTMCYVYSK